MTKTEFNQGIEDLSMAIIGIVSDIPIKFEIEDKTTNNYKKMVNDYAVSRILSVSREGADTSIYGNRYVNILARVFHDYIHITRYLDFSKEEERSVAKIQKGMVFNYLAMQDVPYDRAKVASTIIYKDVIEQVEYFYENNKFVENQLEFMMNKLGVSDE